VKRYFRDHLTQAKNEIEVTTGLLHRNLLRPRGCCFKLKPEITSCGIQGDNEEEIILIYDYMPNRSLDCFIFGTYLYGSSVLRLRVSMNYSPEMIYISHSLYILQIPPKQGE
jgi:hypothetical protein